MNDQRIIVRLLPLIALSTLLGACDGNGPTTYSDSSPQSTLQVPDSLLGLWQRRGYGDIFAVGENETAHYAITQSTCLPGETVDGLPQVSVADINRVQIEVLADQSLSLRIPGTVFPIVLTPLNSLPEQCDVTVDANAQSVFDHLWATFNEYYAFFELRGVHWAAQADRIQPRITLAGNDNDNDNVLFDTLSDLIMPLDDRHIILQSNNQEFSPAIEKGIFRELDQGFDEQTEYASFDHYIETAISHFQAVLISYFDEGRFFGGNPIIWATINESIGYINIASMENFIEKSDDELSAFAIDGASQVIAAELAIDTALAELSAVDQLIIDLRLNGGGEYAISLAIANRFTPMRQHVLSKMARGLHGETEPLHAYLDPVSAPFLKPIVLIVGPDTASAAEIFVIAMRQLPQVTVIGQSTRGALSDILEKPLPNGWSYGLSNEVYSDAAGNVFEFIGIPPDRVVETFRLSYIEAGIDPAIELALTLAERGL